MKERTANGKWMEKASAGWWDGCNSSKTSWLLQDTQYVWGVNTVNRGGIIRPRPGFRMKLILPPGNLQGVFFFTPDKSTATVTQPCLVFAVDGKVYYAPFPLTTPSNWETFRLRNINFNPNARQVFFEKAQKSVVSEEEGNLQRIVPTYSVLCMQDGSSDFAYWDGEINEQLNEEATGVPRGTWMVFASGRLWVARGNLIIASDLFDPIGYVERTEISSDFKFNGEITGVAKTVGENRLSNIIVFTIDESDTLLSSIIDRDTWSKTTNFQQVFFPDRGCISGRSITTQAGLLWWYSDSGLVSADSAASSFLTSRIRYRDIEMARCKRNFAPDLSSICSAAFENYLLVSTPSGDPLNAMTMVLDYAIADEILREQGPAWNGVWTGIRPVEWANGMVNGKRRLFAASVDYQEAGGSFNHIWEAFDSVRRDTYIDQDVAGNLTEKSNRIYWNFETKKLGDGLDLKRFLFAELDVTEISGDLQLKCSFGGTKMGFHEILNRRIIATVDNSSESNNNLEKILAAGIQLKPQSRRIVTSDGEVDDNQIEGVEAQDLPNVDKFFGLLIEGCGDGGIEAFRFFMEPYPEKSTGSCEEDETEIQIVNRDGVGAKVPDDAEVIGAPETPPTTEETNPREPSLKFVSPITQAYRDVFYSSIPVAFEDQADCVVCLPCARDTFEPPSQPAITVDGIKMLP